MTLLVWLLRILVLFIVIRFVVLMVRNALAAASGGPASAPGPRARVKRQPERLGGTLVQDPQCGTYLPADRAISVDRGGALQHFCSVECRDKWQARA